MLQTEKHFRLLRYVNRFYSTWVIYIHLIVNSDPRWSISGVSVRFLGWTVRVRFCLNCAVVFFSFPFSFCFLYIKFYINLMRAFILKGRDVILSCDNLLLYQFQIHVNYNLSHVVYFNFCVAGSASYLLSADKQRKAVNVTLGNKMRKM